MRYTDIQLEKPRDVIGVLVYFQREQYRIVPQKDPESDRNCVLAIARALERVGRHSMNSVCGQHPPFRSFVMGTSVTGRYTGLLRKYYSDGDGHPNSERNVAACYFRN